MRFCVGEKDSCLLIPNDSLTDNIRPPCPPHGVLMILPPPLSKLLPDLAMAAVVDDSHISSPFFV
ncbi:hypothetical protein PAXINDRAFT_20124 [Paxillus involutus ATCC 200175]|uniref:Uncharacterized protein n=1 Tax=Paxillus involutus ATCC 200175 TaxID=664439 RepID=A0A0C9SMS4_PAXIN|nr:hypothetical protein PAXINDRAFT_20124 [Paxillus involutus ATCC 200175]